MAASAASAATADGVKGPAASAFDASAKAGWLTKQGGSGFAKNWRRRWFVLEDSYLYYYKTEQDAEPVGIVALDGYVECRAAEPAECSKSKCCWKLVGAGDKVGTRTYFAYAETRPEMVAWMDAINAATAATKHPPAAPLPAAPSPAQPAAPPSPALPAAAQDDRPALALNAFEAAVAAADANGGLEKGNSKLNHLTLTRPHQRAKRAPSRRLVQDTFDEEDDETDGASDAAADPASPVAPALSARSSSASTVSVASVGSATTVPHVSRANVPLPKIPTQDAARLSSASAPITPISHAVPSEPVPTPPRKTGPAGPTSTPLPEPPVRRSVAVPPAAPLPPAPAFAAAAAIPPEMIDNPFYDPPAQQLPPVPLERSASQRLSMALPPQADLPAVPPQRNASQRLSMALPPQTKLPPAPVRASTALAPQDDDIAGELEQTKLQLIQAQAEVERLRLEADDAKAQVRALQSHLVVAATSADIEVMRHDLEQHRAQLDAEREAIEAERQAVAATRAEAEEIKAKAKELLKRAQEIKRSMDEAQEAAESSMLI